ncbi:MAG: hypothetical protein ABIH41_00465 [Nanoarchaeota archaeon]
MDEIILGMASYNAELNGVVANKVVYDEVNRTRYSLGRTGPFVEDPFYVLRQPFQNGNVEYSSFRLRVGLPNEPADYVTLMGRKHNDTKFKLLYPEEWARFDAIECTRISSCRNIEAVECSRDQHRLYIWTHKTPGEGYTVDIRYTMQALDDGREALTTFETFYCTPI